MSTFPSGFPLGDQHLVPNKEGLETRSTNLYTPQPNIQSAAFLGAEQQMHTSTSHSSQPLQESLPLPQEDASQFTVPALTVELPTPNSHTPFHTMSPGTAPLVVPSAQFPTPNSPKSNNILLHPVPQVPLVGIPGGNSSRPQFFLVNQPVEGSSPLPSSYMVALEAAPAGSSSTQLHGTAYFPAHSGHTVGLAPNTTHAPNATYNTEPFTLGKQSRRFTKKSTKGKGKAP